MEEDISTDAVGIPPENKANKCSGTSVNNDQFSQQDLRHQKQNSPLSTLDRSCPPCKIISTESLSEKAIENLDSSEETHLKMIENKSDKTGPNFGVPNEEPSDQINKSAVISTGTTETHTKTQQKELCLPPKPPREWRLNGLLDHIALNIDDNELKRMKQMFSGPEGIGKKVLEECKTSTDFFTVLKQRQYISRDNILYLNKLLYTLGRADLIKKTVQYCLEEGDVIYYYSDDEQPGAGRRQIKIHVKADVQNYSRIQLEELRNVTASIVCVPAEEIQISAIEPGSSLMITITMPEMYVDILKDLLERRVGIQRLIALNVDIIIIDDKQYAVSGCQTDVTVTQQYIEIMNVYQQLETKRKELESLELMHLNCQKELTNARNKLEKVGTIAKYFELVIRDDPELGPKYLDFQRLKSKENLYTPLDKTNDEEREKQTTHESDFRHDHGISGKTAEYILIDKYLLFLNDLNMTLNLVSAEALKRLSETISEEHRTTLIRLYSWSHGDLIKACIDADNRLLLLGLKYKEALIANKRIRICTILDRFGRVVGLDLEKEYKSILGKLKMDQKMKCRLN